MASAILVGKIDPATYESLKNAAMEKNDPEKWKTFAAYALGVPRDEINVVRQGDTPSNKHVNINLTRDFDAEGKTAGFDPAKPPWVQLGPKRIRSAGQCVRDAGARTGARRAPHDRAQPLRQVHRLSTQAPAQQGELPRLGAKQAAGQTVASRAHFAAEIVAGLYDGALAATELEAHIEAAKVAFASGDLVQARTDLRRWRRCPICPRSVRRATCRSRC